MVLLISLLPSKTVKKFVPKKIKHQHKFDETKAEWVRAKTKSGGYVCYAIIRCESNCGKVIVDPLANFKVCTDKHKKHTVKKLQKKGLSIIQ